LNCRERRAAFHVLNIVNVFYIPLGSGRFEPYFEHEGHEEEPVEGAAPRGFIAQMRARFSEMIKEAEEARHSHTHAAPTTLVGRFQRKMMGWVAERVTEQRLLWQLRRVDEAVLHVPDDQDPASALARFRDGLQKDGDRHRRLLALHSLGLLAAAPFVVVPGPNLFGYFFTFTVVGHFLAYRGAGRGASVVRWSVQPDAALTAIGRAVSTPGPDRYRRIHEAAAPLRLAHLARFVERLAPPPA
jgi:Mitochondrial K+-H+ exchange-related